MSRLLLSPVRLVTLLLLLAACDDTVEPPVLSTLQNDDYTSGAASFQSGFASGEAVAVVFGPQPAAFRIRKVMFMFGGAIATRPMTLTITRDVGTLAPGSLMHTAVHQIMPSDVALRELDLSGHDLRLPANSSFRIAFTFQHGGTPAFATDAAITATRNLVFRVPGGWATSESAAFTGDWVIRAEIATP